MQHQYPLDASALVKGQTFPHDELVGIVGKMPTPKDQQLAAMQLGAWIEKQRRDLVCRVLSDGPGGMGRRLHILTDAEAAEWNHRRSTLGVRRLARGVRAQTRVDPSHLSVDQRRAFDYNVGYDARALMALRSAQRSYAGLMAAAVRRVAAAVGKRLNPAPGSGAVARIEQKQTKNGTGEKPDADSR